MNHRILLKTGILYGAYLGVGLCLYTTLMWISELDSTYLPNGQYLDMAIILLPITLIILAIKKLRTKEKKLTMRKRLYIALIVGLISSLIYEPFLYYYHEVINPDWFEAVVDLKRNSLVNVGLEEDQVSAKLQYLRAQNQASSSIFSGFLGSAVLLPILIVFLSLLIIRNKRTPDLKNS